MSHEEVRTRLEASIKNMKTITDKFLSAIVVSVEKIPYVCPPPTGFSLVNRGSFSKRCVLRLRQVRDALHLQGAEGQPP